MTETGSISTPIKNMLAARKDLHKNIRIKIIPFRNINVGGLVPMPMQAVPQFGVYGTGNPSPTNSFSLFVLYYNSCGT